MSKFDQVINRIQEGMSVRPVNNNLSLTGSANQNNLLSTLASTVGANIKGANSQQAIQDLQNLVLGISSKNTKAVDDIVKRYVNMAIKNPQQTGSTGGGSTTVVQ